MPIVLENDIERIIDIFDSRTGRDSYYAALLSRRGPHIASHSVCPSVPLLLPSVTSRHLANYSDTHCEVYSNLKGYLFEIEYVIGRGMPY